MLGDIQVFANDLLVQQMLKLCGQKIKSNFEEGYRILRVTQYPPSTKISAQYHQKPRLFSYFRINGSGIKINLTVAGVFS